MTTLKTTLHRYRFPSAAHPEYKAMVRRIEANADGRGHWMHCISGNRGDSARHVLTGGVGIESEPVELEPAHLFGNQWNEADGTEKGRRLFDWYEEALAVGNSRNPLKIGHWLEITPEMAEARRQTVKCGYCGHQHGPYHTPAPADGFCAVCLDSAYLKPEDLNLLRLRSIAEEGPSFKDRPPLTDDERTALMARYVERQTTGNDSRAAKNRAKQRADVLAKFEKESAAAATERDGMLWLWDRNIPLDNVIFYDHKNEFSIGWRSALAPEVREQFTLLMTGFPFPWKFAEKK